MLWLGLHLPRLPLEVFQRADIAEQPDGAATALAICVDGLVEQAGAVAQARGVAVGQKRATALALAPDLILLERDPAREAQALTQLAGWALQFTPRLSLVAPATSTAAGLLLDIEASLGLFGGLPALLERVRHGLHALGYTASLGCAPTPTAAWLFARRQDGLVARTEAQLAARLADLPLDLLDSLHPHRDAIDAIGVRVFRDLLRLPRNGLARRYGKALLQELDAASGRQPDIRPWYEPPARFASSLELLADVEHAQALLFAARRLFCELVGWLTARQMAVRRLVLEARHDRIRRDAPRPPTMIEACFAQPTRDIDRMLGVLRERLTVIGLPAAVHTLVLRCDEVVPDAPGSGSLLPVATSTEEHLGRLVERLQARLGRDQVQRILLAADHRPEAAYRIEPVGTRPPAGSGPLSPMLAHVPRPLWLLHPPLPLRERNQRPWWRGPLTLLSGPERIEGGWWDSNLVQRDYFIAEGDDAQWFWIYRTRGQPVAVQPASWYLQGVFG